MTTYLLDANVLIALTVAEHEHHERATGWAATAERFAVCPVVEGALIRFMVRMGESPRLAVQVLQAVRGLPACDFWPDSLSYVDVPLAHVQGHRQVTDAYLVGLVEASPDARLATFDEALVKVRPDLTVAIP